MSFRKGIIILLYSIIVQLPTILRAQVAMGSWRTHLPYNRAIAVASTPEKVYCATDNSLFSYSKIDNSVEPISKINGLSDIGFSMIEYSQLHDILIIAYSNGNIDLIKNGNVVNVSDLKRKQIFGNKRINNITIINDYAYLACGFGIVVFNLKKLEIADTYIIGYGGSNLNINDIASDGNNLWAATDNGIFKADINSTNLLDYNNWNLITNLPEPQAIYTEIASFDGKMYAVQSSGGYYQDKLFVTNGNSWEILSSEYNNVSFVEEDKGKLIICSDFIDVFDKQGNKIRHIYTYGGDYHYPLGKMAQFDENQTTLWIADRVSGLIKSKDDFNSTIYFPNGPFSTDVVDIDIEEQNIWAASGGLYSANGAYAMVNDKWISYNPETNTNLLDVRGFHRVAVDPNNSNHVAVGTLGFGIVEFINGEVINIYNEKNSSLQNMDNFGSNYVRIGGLTFDKNSNLWVGNYGIRYPISLRKNNGEWTNFSDYSYSNYFTPNDVISNIVATSWGDKWVNFRDGKGVFIFNESDKTKHLLTTVKASDNSIISGNVFAVAEDENGSIWVGTDKGAVVYYSPENAFSGKNFYASYICVETPDTFCHRLLESESVMAIAIDGANRKWFGTANNGVYLMSEDGTEQIRYFNIDNSPLLSNTINDIEINHKTGEVFFATSKGLISYKSEATNGSNFFTDVYVYPNPVRPEYEGMITITGLVTNVNVKITDLTGNLVYETNALGGQAVWDGKTLSGQKVHSGVYLIYCTTAGGERTHVAKLLFLN